MKRRIYLLMALVALLTCMPMNVDAQAIIPKSRFSARNVAPQVKEHNVLTLFCMNYFDRDFHLYPDGTPLYYLTGNSRCIIKVNGYKPVSRFGETTKGDLAWTRECSYENGRLKNIRYSQKEGSYISAGDVDIYEYDVVGRIVKVTRYNSDGEYKRKAEFSASSQSWYFNSCELEKKDDGYLFYCNWYKSDLYYNHCSGTNWSYGGDVACRNKYTVNMQSGYVERVCYWRYKKLTIKGRLAGKKYNWHYSNSAMIRFDPECCFFPDNDYIVEYEEVL